MEFQPLKKFKKLLKRLKPLLVQMMLAEVNPDVS
jgi:hypothetical protein